MQENTNWYWKKKPLQQTITVPTLTIIHPYIDVITTRYVQGTPKNICNRIQAKKPYKDILLLLLMLIMIIFRMKLSVVEKLSLKGMWVAIVTINGTDDNNNNEILYVVFHYIFIRYQYVNIIWIFIFFSVFSLLLESFMFILFKINWCPNVSNSIK